MYAISLIGKHKTLFAKTATMIEAKEYANEKLNNPPDFYGHFDYATIYNQEDKKTIMKDGIGCEWVVVD